MGKALALGGKFGLGPHSRSDPPYLGRIREKIPYFEAPSRLRSGRVLLLPHRGLLFTYGILAIETDEVIAIGTIIQPST